VSDVRFELDGAIARVTLDRPERHNAFDASLVEAFAGALGEVETRDLRCVVIAGAGRSFSSGGDLEMLSGLDARAARQFMIDATLAFRRLERLRAPVIAEVHGHCLGGGLELALHCDFVIASDDATFGLPEAQLGLTPTAGAAERLMAIVGTMRARELLYTGRRLTADEAVRAGLVADVVPRASLQQVVMERARAIAAAPPEGIAALKALTARRLAHDQTAAWIAELETFEALLRARGR
jgi:enoyl-CoA hydratase/carnithine racemase